MRKILVLSMCVTCAGCFNPTTTASQTALQKYETSLHIYLMERERLEKDQADAAKSPNSTEPLARANEQVARVQRAKTRLDAAEAALPNDSPSAH